jgi:glycerol-3-phosphate O-acyltransferase
VESGRMASFLYQGYLIIKDFFTDEELQACRDDLEDEVDKLAQKLHKAGKIKSGFISMEGNQEFLFETFVNKLTFKSVLSDLYEEYDLDHRLMKIDEEWPGAVILLHKIGRLPPVRIYTYNLIPTVKCNLIG